MQRRSAIERLKPIASIQRHARSERNATDATNATLLSLRFGRCVGCVRCILACVLFLRRLRQKSTEKYARASRCVRCVGRKLKKCLLYFAFIFTSLFNVFSKKCKEPERFFQSVSNVDWVIDYSAIVAKGS